MEESALRGVYPCIDLKGVMQYIRDQQVLFTGNTKASPQRDVLRGNVIRIKAIGRRIARKASG